MRAVVAFGDTVATPGAASVGTLATGATTVTGTDSGGEATGVGFAAGTARVADT